MKVIILIMSMIEGSYFGRQREGNHLHNVYNRRQLFEQTA